MRALWEWYTRELEAAVKKAGQLLRSRFGIWALGILSFGESALLLPIVTDPFMVAYIVANRARAFQAFVVTTATSVLGGVFAFLTAAFFMELIARYFSEKTAQAFHDVTALFSEGTFMLAFLGALTPIPYTLTAIVAGALEGSLVMFIVGSIIGRVLRYGIFAYLTYRFGEASLELARKNILLMSLLSILVVVLYVWHKM